MLDKGREDPLKIQERKCLGTEFWPYRHGFLVKTGLMHKHWAVKFFSNFSSMKIRLEQYISSAFIHILSER